jgi:RNA polymerase sigma-70 factor (ECF subfamily)
MLGRLQLDERLAAKVDVSGVVQITLLEAERAGWQELDDEDRVPWLRRILANNLLDEIRKYRTQARDIGREYSIQQAIDESSARVDQWLVAAHSSPSQRAIRKEQAMRLARALSFLPNAQRQAIELHHLRGLPLDDVSERMNRTKGAVAALVYRGTTRLRELLSKED